MDSDTTASIFLLIPALVLMALRGLPLFVFHPNTKHWDETIGIKLILLEEQITAKTAELQRNKDLVSL